MVWLALLSLGIWLYLILAHGGFWRSTPELAPAQPLDAPDVDIIVPARDEAATIGRVLTSLLAQHYAGRFRVILVDDESADGTAEIARAAVTAAAANGPAGAASAAAATATAGAGGAPTASAATATVGAAAAATATVGAAGAAPAIEGVPLLVIAARPKPPGWSGKLWAVSEGVRRARAPLLLLADADIEHDPRHLATLVARLNAPRVDLVSEMVRLNCSSRAERGLVPAFVYFFQMLYPFARVNNPTSSLAAAAGGTMLIRRAALERIGGVEAIKGALIDDVALAAAVKRGGPIFLGHSGLAVSIRRYPRAADIWDMITRTAFTQLRHSAGLLALTLLGLTLVWWVPIAAAVLGHGWARAFGLTAFALGGISFVPTLRRYRRSALWSLALPLIAFFYMAATLSSALKFWRGGGARWKNRTYEGN
jgi:hopene-associated glycosyltransferase HpnB